MKPILQLLLLGSLFAVGCAGRPVADPIVVGHLAPRSGPRQAIGLAEEQGILLAVEEANAAPVNGRTFEALHVDTRGDADTAAHQAVRLVTINRAVGLVGGHGPAAAEKLSRVAENYKMLYVTPAWLPPDTLAPFSISVGLTPAERGKALARFAAQKKKQRLVALADLRDPAAAALVAAFAAELPKEPVLTQQSYAATDKPAPLAGLAVREIPDAVLIAGRGEDLQTWRAALGAAGLKPEVPILFGGDDVGFDFTDAAGPEKQSPVYTTTAFVAEGGPKEAQEFTQKFQKRFGKLPDPAAALAYDSARALFESIRRTQSLQGTKLRDDLLARKDFVASTGPITFAKDGTAQRPAFVVQQTEKGPRLVWGPGEKP